MATIEWKEEYSLGCEEIDCEHRVFVTIIRKIEEAIESNIGPQFVSRLLSELEKYTVFHFTSEENVMIRMGFPDIIHHKCEHEHLLAKLREILLKVELEREPLDQLSAFLLDWFLNHTMCEDRNFVAYLQPE